MSLRKPFAVAVVGALLVGGATTGTTLALWRDSATLASSQLQSGGIELQVNGSRTATFAAISDLALNNGATAGTPQSFGATLKSASTGKNMRMTMQVLDVSTESTTLNDGLEIALSSAAQVADCSPATTGYTALSATNALAVSPSPVSNGGTRALCVSIRMRGGAPTATAGTTGALTFSFYGEQVRP